LQPLPLAAQQGPKRAPVGELGKYLGHKGTVYSVAISRDEKQLVSCGKDGTVRLWELETGKEIKQHKDHTEIAWCVAYSPDGQFVLSGGGGTYDMAADKFNAGKDNDLRLWAADSLREIRRFTGHRGAVMAVAFAPDGKTAVSSGQDSTVRFWDIASGKEIKQLGKGKIMAKSLCFSPDGQYLLVGGGSRSDVLTLWEIESGKEVQFKGRKEAFTGHNEAILSVAFAADGKRAASSSVDGTVRLWDMQTGKELRVLKHPSGVSSVVISPDGHFAVTGSGVQRRQDGDRRVISAPSDWLLRVWDLDKGKEIGQFPGHGRGLTDVKLTADGRRALSTSVDGTIRLWGLPELKAREKK
jgi:WD40 repeat protein